MSIQQLPKLELRAGLLGYGAVTASYDPQYNAVFLMLDAPDGERAAVLTRWAEDMRIVDMSRGVYRGDDPFLRLSLRGLADGSPLLPTGTAMCVSAPWPSTSPQAAAIRHGVAGDPHRLLARLRDLDDRC
ncbi:hypothetical protein [Saccharopolyspora sp. 6M]|uniref:hypothetical protein n=1 Tax=Saccharopolyspora sp. 6M TaxID=2877237 RepID=UPI001CD304CC|nr:hypothetical protein [Saccharopolyspora sp. 6M]MCA1228651.1 hypothetical protein [Saccharopolyspora sp. 6M]